jgi:hypothetical protein
MVLLSAQPRSRCTTLHSLIQQAALGIFEAWARPSSTLVGRLPGIACAAGVISKVEHIAVRVVPFGPWRGTAVMRTDRLVLPLVET